MTNKELFQAARKIADLTFSHPNVSTDPGCLNSGYVWLEDRRNEDVNPYYNQTKQGLFFEIYYGSPGHLWTPWGKWNFAGSSSGFWDNILLDILSMFDVKMYQEMYHTEMGGYGPVYSLHKVLELVLPDPIAILDGEEFKSYEQAKAEWEALKNETESENVQQGTEEGK